MTSKKLCTKEGGGGRADVANRSEERQVINLSVSGNRDCLGKQKEEIEMYTSYEREPKI